MTAVNCDIVHDYCSRNRFPYNFEKVYCYLNGPIERYFEKQNRL